MKFLHTADLHIGKTVNEFLLLEDQEFVLRQIAEIAVNENVDGVIIAGDIYDRSVPPAEAVSLLDSFLSELIRNKIAVYIISGNHDSPERLSFAGSILEKEGLHIAGTFSGKPKTITLEDEFGMLHLVLLPFFKPSTAKHYLPDKPIDSYEDGVREVLKMASIKPEERNLCITHHFVTFRGTEPEQSDSETRLAVGGTENIDVSCFDAFDYVALGHIHGPQKIGRDEVRYAGSPMKYSFSEVFHKKSVMIVELREKGKVSLTEKRIQPLHDMRKIKGSLENLMKKEVYSLGDTKDYLQVTLTNREELIDPLGTLRGIYQNVMQLLLEKNDYEKKDGGMTAVQKENKSTMELFQEFYEYVTEQPFDEVRQEKMMKAIEEVEGVR